MCEIWFIVSDRIDIKLANLNASEFDCSLFIMYSSLNYLNILFDASMKRCLLVGFNLTKVDQRGLSRSSY